MDVVRGNEQDRQGVVVRSRPGNSEAAGGGIRFGYHVNRVQRQPDPGRVLDPVLGLQGEEGVLPRLQVNTLQIYINKIKVFKSVVENI